MNEEITLAIDPGISGCGWAIFEGITLQDCGVISLHTKFKDWWKKVCTIVSCLKNENAKWHCTRVLLEWTEFRQSGRGFAAAASGDLFQLAFLQGAITYAFRDRDVQLIFPSKWMGNLPEKVIQHRLETAYGHHFRTHECDAVGMGIVTLLREEGIVTTLANLPQLSASNLKR